MVTKTNSRMVDRVVSAVNVKDFGAVGDGVADDTAAIQAALDTNAAKLVFPDGNYLFTHLRRSMTGDMLIEGSNSTLKCTLAASQWQAVYFETLGHNLTIKELTIDVNSNAYQGLAIQNESLAEYADVLLEDVTVLNTYRSGTTYLGGDGIWIRGAYRNVNLVRPVVKNVRMAAGAGISGSQGAFGISILANFAGDLMPQYVTVNDPYVEDVYSEDNTYTQDQDGLRLFGIDDASIPQGFARVNGGVFKNCWGRSIKVQRPDCIVRGTAFIRDTGNATGGGNTEIDFQRGGGTVRDITCNYKSTNPTTVVNSYGNTSNTYSLIVDGVSVYAENTTLTQVVMRYTQATLAEPIPIVVKNVKVVGSINQVLRYLTQNSSANDLHELATLENIYVEQTDFLAQVYGKNTGQRVDIYARNCMTTGSGARLIDEGDFSNAVEVRAYEDYIRGFSTGTDSFYVATLTPDGGTVTLNPNENRLHFMRKGRVVSVYGQIRVSGVSSPTGNLKLNLPFPNQRGTQGSALQGHNIVVNASATKNANGFGLEVPIDGSSIYISDTSGNTLNYNTAPEMKTNTRLYINFEYVAEDDF